MKGVEIGYDMVAWHNKQSIAGISLKRCPGDGRCRVAAKRFQQDEIVFDTGGAELLIYDVGMPGICDQDRPLYKGWTKTACAPHGELEHGFLGRQRQQLLRPFGPRYGPESRTGSAGKDNRNNRRGAGHHNSRLERCYGTN